MILTKQQWVGVGILLTLIALVEVFVHVVPQPERETDSRKDSLLLSVADTLSKPRKYYRYQRDTISIHLQTFDPNTADSMTLLHLGLQPWQVKNMLKYRAKGGCYRKAEDMKRLYGMTDSLYAVLLPYISIDSSRFITPKDTARQQSKRYITHKKDTVLELNAADTTSLQYIVGIGRATACAIVRYREALGGYVHVEQLREIPRYLTYVDWQISWDTIFPHLTVCTDSVQPIPVNCVSVNTLMRHPYIRFEQAKAIYEYRRNHFEVRHIDELRAIPALPDSLLTKLTPYLSFAPCDWNRQNSPQ